jgi:3-isopropylmalate dehydrogenase
MGGNGVLPTAQCRFSTPLAPSMFFVMPGLDPGINVFRTCGKKDVDGRDKPGHDELVLRKQTMPTHKLLLLPGDGIGPEVMAEVKRLIGWLNAEGIVHFETEQGLVGGSAYDADKVAITDATMALAQASDAVIFGAVGGPKWDQVPYDSRPEAGLLRLRKEMALFANLRPAICYPALAESSSLKREVIEGLDIMIVRELTGGVYFGEPKTITDLGNGQKRAVDTQVYDTYEIERIARVAFDLARKRRNKLTSMEKRNVMKSGVLWNEVVTQVHKREYQDVELEHQLADSGGMSLVRWPKQFDVIVTDNLFGDMLSDIAAMLTGSLGMLPSASLGDVDPRTKRSKALYEPVHGSAPDIAGTGAANPIAMIASFNMALRYSFGMGALADKVDSAIAAVLAKGLRTADIKSEGTIAVSTTEMGEAILQEVQALHG